MHNSSGSILSSVISRVVIENENKFKNYMLREDQGPSFEEIEQFSKRITLTDLERRIIDLLNECKEAIDQKKITMPECPTVFEHHQFTKGTVLDYLNPIISPSSVTLRFAGGWVRDKLLGINSADIDVSIDSLTGKKFASVFCAFVRQKGIPISSVAVVAARPDQSKHLETACLSLFNQKIDFVNLRSEMYSETSRIPSKMVFGSPSDDAHRRDITINSLFFNIHTRKVEDWTGRGLKDLSMRIIRTPLPPAAIFADDPLRILRVIRFASRFEFSIDPEISAALLNNPKLRQLLFEKISRERIGIEIKKMLTGPNPFLSLKIIWDLNLWTCVFWQQITILNLNEFHTQFTATQNFEPNLTLYENHTALKGWRYAQILHFFWSQSSLLSPIFTKKVNPETIFLLYLCAIFYPHRGFYTWKSTTDLTRSIPVYSFLCRFAIKLPNAEEEKVSAAIKSAHYFIELIENNSKQLSFDQVCSCLRLVGPHWEFAWALAQVISFKKALSIKLDEASFDSPTTLVDLELLQKYWADITGPFDNLIQLIFDYHLDCLWTTRPILNGLNIIKLLGFPKGNLQVHRLLQELIVWQLKNGITEGGNPEDIKEAMNYLTSIYQTRPDLLLSENYPPKLF